jgi:hypothetical protein
LANAIDIADFDIGGFHAWPFGARWEQLFGGKALCPERQSAGSINRRQPPISSAYAKRSH